MNKTGKVLLVDGTVRVPANCITFNGKNEPVITIREETGVSCINIEKQDPLETINATEVDDGEEMSEEIEEPVFCEVLCNEPSEQVSRQVWPQDHTLALIEAVDDNYEDMHDVNKRKNVWKVICTILESHGLQYSEDACKKKWSNLLRTYKVVKDNKNKNGRGATTRFPFFEKINDIVGELPTNKSPHSIDVRKTPRIEDESSGTSIHGISFTVIEEDKDVMDKRRKRKYPITECYIKFKKSYYEKKEKRSEEKHKERKRCMNQMLALQKQKVELLKERNLIEERKVRALETLCTTINNK